MFAPTVLLDTWLGAYDKHGDDVFYWVDDTLVSAGYTNWYEDQPSHGDDDYMYFGVSYDYQWLDAPSNAFMRVFCERYT